MKYIYILVGIAGIAHLGWYLQQPTADSNFLVTSVATLFFVLVATYGFKPYKINTASNIALVGLCASFLPLPFDFMYIALPCAIVLVVNFFISKKNP